MTRIEQLLFDTPNGLHTPWRTALGTPPCVYRQRNKVWASDGSTDGSVPLNTPSGLPNGDSALVSLFDHGAYVQGVVGFNKSATRLFFRIRTKSVFGVPTPGVFTYKTLVAFPVEGSQAFAHAQPFSLPAGDSSAAELIFDFAVNELPATATTAGAYYGTVFWAYGVTNP